MSDGRCLLGTGRADASADLAMLRVTSEANARLSVCPLSVYCPSSGRRGRVPSGCRPSQVSTFQEYKNAGWGKKKIENGVRARRVADKLEVERSGKKKVASRWEST